MTARSAAWVCMAAVAAAGLASGACGGKEPQAARTTARSSTTTASPPTHPAYSALGRAMLAPGDRLTTPVDTFGTLHFDPPDSGVAPKVQKDAALQAIPNDQMPNKLQRARVKLATWVDDSQAKLQPSRGQARRVLVWLVVEPSQPGGEPTGACCPSQEDAQRQADYYRNWPTDIFAMVDASTGALINGVMQYGVT